MSDDLAQAKLIFEVRLQTPFIIADIDQELKNLGKELPNHRLSQLVNSLAWHTTRQTPPERLREFARELARLWQKVGEQSTEGQFYTRLMIRLEVTRELAVLQDNLKDRLDRLKVETNAISDKRERRERERRERGQITLLQDELKIYKAIGQCVQQNDDKRHWGGNLIAILRREGRDEQIPLARLLLTLTALSVTDTLTRSAELCQQIGEEALIWQ